MRYSFIGKKSGKHYVYANEMDALLGFRIMFGTSLNCCILRFLVDSCCSDFTFENEYFILKGEKDD